MNKFIENFNLMECLVHSFCSFCGIYVRNVAKMGSAGPVHELQFRNIHHLYFCSNCVKDWNDSISKNEKITLKEPYNSITPPLAKDQPCSVCSEERADMNIYNMAGYNICECCIQSFDFVCEDTDKDLSSVEGKKETFNGDILFQDLNKIFRFFCKKEPTKKRKDELLKLESIYNERLYNLGEIGRLNIDEAIYIACYGKRGPFQTDMGNMLFRASIPLFLHDFEDIIVEILDTRWHIGLQASFLLFYLHYPEFITEKIYKSIKKLTKEEAPLSPPHLSGRGFISITWIARDIVKCRDKKRYSDQCSFCGLGIIESKKLIMSATSTEAFENVNTCSFCGKYKSEVRKLVSVQDQQSICDECCERFAYIIEETLPKGQKVARVGSIWGITSLLPGTYICGKCLEACKEIIEKDEK